VSDPDAIATSPIILIAHGSRADLANESHRELCREVSHRTGATVVAAFLELAQPTIGDAIDSVINDGASRLVVSPHFLLPGNHTRVDIPEIVADALLRHPHVEIELTDHLGADPALVDLVADRVRRHT